MKLSKGTTNIIIIVLFLIWFGLMIRGIYIRPQEEGFIDVLEMKRWNYS